MEHFEDERQRVGVGLVIRVKIFDRVFRFHGQNLTQPLHEVKG
jgi:hypothetical protein